MKLRNTVLLLLILVFTLSAAAWFNQGTHERYVEPVETAEYEFENYRIHIVTEHPNLGHLESLKHNEGKRDMVLQAGRLEDMVETCNILYGGSITEHRSPCPKLQQELR